jgi:PIN domain nuclease of toxin-antitoxin system
VSIVLDSSAVLAAILDERGGELVLENLADGQFSTVNLSEALAKLGERGLGGRIARQQIDRLDLELHPFDAAMAERTAELRRQTRQYGLSLGDRACLALGAAMNLPVLTADQRMVEAGLHLGLDLRSIR